MNNKNESPSPKNLVSQIPDLPAYLVAAATAIGKKEAVRRTAGGVWSEAWSLRWRNLHRFKKEWRPLVLACREIDHPTREPPAFSALKPRKYCHDECLWDVFNN